MKTQLRTLLLADAAVAATGAKISWGQRQAGNSLPAIVLTTVSPDLNYTFEGRSDLRQDQVQFDVWANTFASADDIAQKVIAAVERGGTHGGILFSAAFLSSERQTVEDVAGIGSVFRVSLDINVWWNKN